MLIVLKADDCRAENTTLIVTFQNVELQIKSQDVQVPEGHRAQVLCLFWPLPLPTVRLSKLGSGAVAGDGRSGQQALHLTHFSVGANR